MSGPSNVQKLVTGSLGQIPLFNKETICNLEKCRLDQEKSNLMEAEDEHKMFIQRLKQNRHKEHLQQSLAEVAAIVESAYVIEQCNSILGKIPLSETESSTKIVRPILHQQTLEHLERRIKENRQRHQKGLESEFLQQRVLVAQGKKEFSHHDFDEVKHIVGQNYMIFSNNEPEKMLIELSAPDVDQDEEENKARLFNGISFGATKHNQLLQENKAYEQTIFNRGTDKNLDLLISSQKKRKLEEAEKEHELLLKQNRKFKKLRVDFKTTCETEIEILVKSNYTVECPPDCIVSAKGFDEVTQIEISTSTDTAQIHLQSLRSHGSVDNEPFYNQSGHEYCQQIDNKILNTRTEEFLDKRIEAHRQQKKRDLEKEHRRFYKRWLLSSKEKANFSEQGDIFSDIEDTVKICYTVNDGDNGGLGNERRYKDGSSCFGNTSQGTDALISHRKERVEGDSAGETETTIIEEACPAEYGTNEQKLFEGENKDDKGLLRPQNCDAAECGNGINKSATFNSPETICQSFDKSFGLDDNVATKQTCKLDSSTLTSHTDQQSHICDSQEKDVLLPSQSQFATSTPIDSNNDLNPFPSVSVSPVLINAKVYNHNLSQLGSHDLFEDEKTLQYSLHVSFDDDETTLTEVDKVSTENEKDLSSTLTEERETRATDNNNHTATLSTNNYTRSNESRDDTISIPIPLVNDAINNQTQIVDIATLSKTDESASDEQLGITCIALEKKDVDNFSHSTMNEVGPCKVYVATEESDKTAIFDSHSVENDVTGTIMIPKSEANSLSITKMAEELDEILTTDGELEDRSSVSSNNALSTETLSESTFKELNMTVVLKDVIDEANNSKENILQDESVKTAACIRINSSDTIGNKEEFSVENKDEETYSSSNVPHVEKEQLDKGSPTRDYSGFEREGSPELFSQQQLPSSDVSTTCLSYGEDMLQKSNYAMSLQKERLRNRNGINIFSSDQSIGQPDTLNCATPEATHILATDPSKLVIGCSLQTGVTEEEQTENSRRHFEDVSEAVECDPTQMAGTATTRTSETCPDQSSEVKSSLLLVGRNSSPKSLTLIEEHGSALGGKIENEKEQYERCENISNDGVVIQDDKIYLAIEKKHDNIKQKELSTPRDFGSQEREGAEGTDPINLNVRSSPDEEDDLSLSQITEFRDEDEMHLVWSQADVSTEKSSGESATLFFDSSNNVESAEKQKSNKNSNNNFATLQNSEENVCSEHGELVTDPQCTYTLKSHDAQITQSLDNYDLVESNQTADIDFAPLSLEIPEHKCERDINVVLRASTPKAHIESSASRVWFNFGDDEEEGVTSKSDPPIYSEVGTYETDVLHSVTQPCTSDNHTFTEKNVFLNSIGLAQSNILRANSNLTANATIDVDIPEIAESSSPLPISSKENDGKIIHNLSHFQASDSEFQTRSDSSVSSNESRTFHDPTNDFKLEKDKLQYSKPFFPKTNLFTQKHCKILHLSSTERPSAVELGHNKISNMISQKFSSEADTLTHSRSDTSIKVTNQSEVSNNTTNLHCQKLKSQIKILSPNIPPPQIFQSQLPKESTMDVVDHSSNINVDLYPCQESLHAEKSTLILNPQSHPPRPFFQQKVLITESKPIVSAPSVYQAGRNTLPSYQIIEPSDDLPFLEASQTIDTIMCSTIVVGAGEKTTNPKPTKILHLQISSPAPTQDNHAKSEKESKSECIKPDVEEKHQHQKIHPAPNSSSFKQNLSLAEMSPLSSVAWKSASVGMETTGTANITPSFPPVPTTTSPSITSISASPSPSSSLPEDQTSEKISLSSLSSATPVSLSSSFSSPVEEHRTTGIVQPIVHLQVQPLSLSSAVVMSSSPSLLSSSSLTSSSSSSSLSASVELEESPSSSSLPTLTGSTPSSSIPLKTSVSWCSSHKEPVLKESTVDVSSKEGNSSQQECSRRTKRKQKLQLAVIAELERLTKEIRHALRVDRPDIPTAMVALQDLDDLPITAGLLARAPSTLDTLKKCTKYSLNTEIRELSYTIYQRYNGLMSHL